MTQGRSQSEVSLHCRDDAGCTKAELHTSLDDRHGVRSGMTSPGAINKRNERKRQVFIKYSASYHSRQRTPQSWFGRRIHTSCCTWTTLRDETRAAHKGTCCTPPNQWVGAAAGRHNTSRGRPCCSGTGTRFGVCERLQGSGQQANRCHCRDPNAATRICDTVINIRVL